VIDQLHDKKKQFVVAALVSVREIETTDLSIITAANLEFQSLHRSGSEFKLDANSHRTREHKCLGSVQGKKCENIHITYFSFGPNVL
jgi:adenylyl- and sulfurtransferase ThiI